MEKSNKRLDEALGMNTSIPRKNSFNGVPFSTDGLQSGLSSAEVLAQEQEKTDAPEPPWGGDAEDVSTLSHKLRDGDYDDPNIPAEETGEVFDLVVIGGGFSGLAAAYYFNQARERQSKVLILESHRMFGGNARRDEFTVKGKTMYAPQGSLVAQDLPPGLAPSSQVEKIFQELNIDSWYFASARPACMGHV